MRNKRFILAAAVALSCFGTSTAQRLPETSTADSPKWYYIQVVGDAARADLVFTAEGSKVAGRAVITTLDPATTATQLWRFEKNQAGRYVITNKGNGEQLDVAYDEEESTGRAVTAETSAVTFELRTINTNYFQIVSSEAAPNTDTSEIYLHQGNSGYDYAVITVNTTWSSGQSSQFHFEPYVDYNIAYSDSLTETYYHLASAGPTFKGQSITERDADDELPATLTLTDAADGDLTAQWRAVKAGDGVRFVNRASGRVLQSDPDPYGLFNLLQTGTLVATGNTWTATYLGDGQYAFSAAAADDNIERYMGTAASTAAELTAPDENKLTNSDYAWTLTKVETVATGIADATPDDGISVSVNGRRIVVSGTADYQIYALSGRRVGTSAALAPGIYIVRAAGTAHKVIVK